MAKEFKPDTCKSTQQNDMTKVSLLNDETMDVRPKDTVQCLQFALNHQHNNIIPHNCSF